jgi:hypothetical protein
LGARRARVTADGGKAGWLRSGRATLPFDDLGVLVAGRVLDLLTADDRDGRLRCHGPDAARALLLCRLLRGGLNGEEAEEKKGWQEPFHCECPFRVLSQGRLPAAGSRGLGF